MRVKLKAGVCRYEGQHFFGGDEFTITGRFFTVNESRFEPVAPEVDPEPPAVPDPVTVNATPKKKSRAKKKG